VVLTTYAVLGAELGVTRGIVTSIKWLRVVLDEVGRLRVLVSSYEQLAIVHITTIY
jgi:hypothetical protein